MRTKSIESMLWWMILATMVLPLVVWSNALSPFHFGKVISFRILVEVMTVFWAVLMVAQPRYRIRWTPLTIALTAVVASFALSTLFAEDRLYAWWGVVERMGGLFTFLHYWVYYLILVSVVREREKWEKLLQLSVWVGVLASIYGFAQWFSIESFLGIKIVGFERNDPIGTVGNAAMFAGYLLFTLFWSAYFFLRDIKKWWYGIAFLVMALALVLANTRAPIGGFFIGMTVAFGVYAFSRNGGVQPKLRRIALVLFIGAILFVVAIFALRTTSVFDGVPVLEQADSIRISNETFQTRIWTWHSVWSGIKERPLLGWGPDNVFVPFNKYFNPLHFTGFGSETWFDRAHNIFFDLMATQGAIGFIANIFLFAMVFRAIYRTSRRDDDPLKKALLTGLMVAYLVHLFMFFDVFITYFVFFILLAFLSSSVGEDNLESRKTVPAGVVWGLILTLLIPMVWMIWSWNIQVAMADYVHTRALIAKKYNAQEAARLFDKAITANKAPGRMEARIKLAEFAVEVTSTGALADGITPVSEEDKLLLNELSEKHLRTGIELHPSDTQHVIFLGRILNSLGGIFNQEDKISESVNVLRRGVELSPSRQRMLFELAQALVLEDRIEEALDLLNDSVSSSPNVGVAYWYRAILRSEVDDFKGALDDVKNAQEFGYDIYDDYRDMLRLVNMYLKVERYDVIADLYERIVELAPDSPQYWASLAATYVKLGRYDDARRAALTAAEIAPAFLPAVQEFINSLPR